MQRTLVDDESLEHDVSRFQLSFAVRLKLEFDSVLLIDRAYLCIYGECKSVRKKYSECDSSDHV